MFTRIVVISFLLVILYNLGMGLYYMLNDKGRSDRAVKALTRRIALSVALFVLLLIGMATGIIETHGLTPQVVGEPTGNRPR